MEIKYTISFKATWVEEQDNKKVRIMIFEEQEFNKFQKLWKEQKVHYLYWCNELGSYEKNIYFESNPMDSINVRVGFKNVDSTYLDWNIPHFYIDNNNIVLKVKE